jgi:Glyoxalase-like domain
MDRVAFVQRTLFKDLRDLPQRFRYRDGVLSPDQESALITSLERLPFREFEFRGFLGKRRTVSFGCRYDFNVRKLQKAEEIPTFLLALCQTAAEFARLTGGKNSQSIHVQLAEGEDLDAHHQRARAAGAEILMEPNMQFYGDRTYRARDPEGHIWTFSVTVKRMTPAEWDKVSGFTTKQRLD